MTKKRDDTVTLARRFFHAADFGLTVAARLFLLNLLQMCFLLTHRKPCFSEAHFARFHHYTIVQIVICFCFLKQTPLTCK